MLGKPWHCFLKKPCHRILHNLIRDKDPAGTVSFDTIRNKLWRSNFSENLFAVVEKTATIIRKIINGLDLPIMNNQSPVLDERMSCHSIVLAFEKAFRNIELPNIDDYRTGSQGSAIHLLLELILSDIELRHRRGAAIPFSHYLSRFPEIETQPEIMSQLIQHDVQLKRQSGVTINPREYPSQYTIPRQPHNVSDTINPISGYEIKHEVGRGGMSTVYLARQASLNRLVALKTLRTEDTDSEPRDTIRFLAEAELIGTIRHPNIVQIYDYGATPGESPFLALEYLAGGTLAKRLADGPLKPEEAASLVSSLASGIHHAHSLGMVHRDLKPGNILFDENGVPKIIDFGLAKRTNSDITRTQILMGTPAYMAPEQADKKAKFVGPTADVWALGAILYECLTGKRPFNATDNLEVLHAIRYDIPERPQSINRKIPVELEQICLKCLEKAPEDRYSSAESLEQDLLAWVNHRPLSIQKPSVFGRVSKWIRRNQIVSSAMFAICLTLLTAATISGVFGIWALNERKIAATRATEAENEKERADTKTQLAEIERARSDFQRNRAEKLVYANQLQAAERAWEVQRPEITFNNMDDCRWDLRGPEYNFLYSRFNDNQIALFGHRFNVSAVAISPDGKTIMSGDAQGNVRVYDMCNASFLIDHPKQVNGAISSIQFSPLGSEVAIWSRGSVRVYARSPSNQWLKQSASIHEGSTEQGMIVTGPVWRFGSLMVPDRDVPSSLFLRSLSNKKDRKTVIHSLYKNLGPIRLTAISPDTKQLAVARGNTVTIHDAATDKRIGNVLHGQSAGHVSALAYSPDGSVLAIAWNDGLLRLYQLGENGISKDFTRLQNYETPREAVLCIAFTPDSQLLLTGGATMGLTAWDWRKGRLSWVKQGHRDAIRSIAVSNNGRFAITGSEDCTARIWDLHKTSMQRYLPETTGPITAIASSQDGSSLACIDRTKNQVLVTIPGTQQIYRRYNDVAADVNILAMTPDGQSMAMPCNDGAIRVIRQRTGRFALTTSGWAGKITAIALSDDGGLLAVATAHPANIAKPTSFRVIEVASGNTLWVNDITNDSSIAIFHFINGKQIIATVDRDGKMICWNTSTGRQLFSPLTSTNPDFIKNPPGKIRCVTSNSDGSLLATGHDDGSILTWNLPDWSLAGQWRNPACELQWIAFSSDSQKLIFAFRLHTGRTQLGFLDWRYNLNMVSVEVDSPKLGSTLSIQIATEKEGPIVFVGHTRGLRRIGSGYLQDHFWLKGSPTTIKKINLIGNGAVAEATLGEHPPIRWNMVTGRLLTEEDQEMIGLPEHPARDLTLHRLSSTVLVVDIKARTSNHAGNLAFCKAIATPIASMYLAEYAESSTNQPPIVQAFQMAMARQLSFWENSRSFQEWDTLSKTEHSSMAHDLKINWCTDLIGRSILTGVTPSGQTTLPGFRGDISTKNNVIKP